MKGLNNYLYMIKRMFQLWIVENTSIIVHLNEFNKLMIDLKNINEAFSNEKQGIMSLASLPYSFKKMLF